MRLLWCEIVSSLSVMRDVMRKITKTVPVKVSRPLCLSFKNVVPPFLVKHIFVQFCLCSISSFF